MIEWRGRLVPDTEMWIIAGAAAKDFWRWNQDEPQGGHPRPQGGHSAKCSNLNSLQWVHARGLQSMKCIPVARFTLKTKFKKCWCRLADLHPISFDWQLKWRVEPGPPKIGQESSYIISGKWWMASNLFLLAKPCKIWRNLPRIYMFTSQHVTSTTRVNPGFIIFWSNWVRRYKSVFFLLQFGRFLMCSVVF